MIFICFNYLAKFKCSFGWRPGNLGMPDKGQRSNTCPDATTGGAPPHPQSFEQPRREHGVTTLAALSLFDAEHRASRIDAGELFATAASETRRPAR
jgi:hypothetical protein